MVSDEDTALPGCNRDCGANGEMFSSGKPGLLLGSLEGLSVLLKLSCFTYTSQFYSIFAPKVSL